MGREILLVYVIHLMVALAVTPSGRSRTAPPVLDNTSSCVHKPGQKLEDIATPPALTVTPLGWSWTAPLGLDNTPLCVCWPGLRHEGVVAPPVLAVTPSGGSWTAPPGLNNTPCVYASLDQSWRTLLPHATPSCRSWTAPLGLDNMLLCVHKPGPKLEGIAAPPELAVTPSGGNRTAPPGLDNTSCMYTGLDQGMRALLPHQHSLLHLLAGAGQLQQG